MNRRDALKLAALALAVSSSPVWADEVGDIVHWLRGLGFDDVTTSRSLLGRVQIRATGATGTRELVVNPRTGEILRDVWVNAEGRVVRGAPYVREADSGDEGNHHGNGGSSGSDGGGDNSGHGGGDDGGDGGSDDSGGGEDGGSNSGSGGGDSGNSDSGHGGSDD